MPTLTSICLNRCCTTTRTPIDGLLRECAATRLADGDTGSDGQGGISHLFSFVDDISSCVYLLDLHFLCEKVRYRGASIGCFVNPHKTRQWDLHPTCPYLSGSTLGALTLRFHCIILINTSKLLPTSLWNSPLAFDVLAKPSNPIPLPPIFSFDALMTSKRI